jgi:hypothetical protein
MFKDLFFARTPKFRRVDDSSPGVQGSMLRDFYWHIDEFFAS